MGLMDFGFREINYQRIKKLHTRGYKDATIADIIRVDTNQDVTEQDVSSYRKMTDLSSKEMLVKKSSMEMLIHSDDERIHDCEEVDCSSVLVTG